MLSAFTAYREISIGQKCPRMWPSQEEEEDLVVGGVVD